MDHLDLYKKEVYDFSFDTLFDEYLSGDHPVFVGPDVHIGTLMSTTSKKRNNSAISLNTI